MNENKIESLDLSLPKTSSNEMNLFRKEKYFPYRVFEELRKKAGIDLNEMPLDEAVDKFMEYYFK